MGVRETRQLDPAIELGYRPYLDGLRCVAVYLVVAFHAGLAGFAGGFVGVDVFFVLSGFLVTRLLLDDLVSRGRIDRRRFYSRRFRRILPAAAVTLLVTAIACLIFVSPLQAYNALGSFRAAFLYFANWHFIQQSTDYFASSVNASPVLHFWSLAVEEQFYLTWPLLLGGLYIAARLAGRHRWLVLRAAVLTGILLSATEALRISTHNLDRAYYGTDTRAYQLLAGAFLALTPQLFELGTRFAHAARRVAPIAIAGLFVLGSSLERMSPITRGIAVVVTTVVLIIALEGADGGAIRRGLSVSPVIYLGSISYATYLWHWPIVVFVTHGHNVNPVSLFLISGVGATLLAAVSYRCLERPIRGARVLDRYRGRVIAASLAASVAAGLVVPAILTTTSATANIASQSLFIPRLPSSSRELLNWRTAQNDIPSVPDCTGRPINECILVQGSGARVLLMGDSLARMWTPAFAEIARRESLTLAVAQYQACPWQQLLRRMPDTPPTCPQHERDWYKRVVPQFDPDIIILAERAFDAPGNLMSIPVRKKSVLANTKLGQQALTTASALNLRELQRSGRKLVILEPTPLPISKSFNPLSCLSTGSKHCSFRVHSTPTGMEHRFQLLANTSAVYALNLDHLVCPRLPVCDPVVNNMIVRRDHTHITGTYAASLAAPIDERLHQRGILPA